MAGTPSASPLSMLRLRLHVRGTVQGVGFRPFVHHLAAACRLAGWVRNASDGVELEVEGEPSALDAFWRRLQTEAPPQAVIVSITRHSIPTEPSVGFHIVESSSTSNAHHPPADIVPDLATCPECLAELLDPGNRRFEYPFINCTRCGPRFSIVEALPYDRRNTTMRGFAMCDACREEYDSPANRRFHAQPNACHDCGPQLTWLDRHGNALRTRADALNMAAETVLEGHIVAIKGIGGFHLFADARSERSITRLRARKQRPSKPLALMIPSIEQVRDEVMLSDAEAVWLASSAAPIILLRRRPESSLPALLAPGNPTLGIMLPHSPLHHLLMRRLGVPVIATSANLSDEPICIDNAEAVRRLHGLADGFLMHDRPIARPVDDSVVRFVAGREMVLRRSRGFAPGPVASPGISQPVLACGADLKATLAVSDTDRVRLSQHLGDLASASSRHAFQKHLEAFPHLAATQPQAVACDLHPAYVSRQIAASTGLPLVGVQHHHAHALACATEHGIEADEPFLAVVWDGTGYGTDGTLWGGEFLICQGASFKRHAWLKPFPLPGGEKAVRDPRFAALGCLHVARIDPADTPLAQQLTDEEMRIGKAMLERRINTPLCSSAGRLFDAVAALCGLCALNDFEGQAAMALEFAASARPAIAEQQPAAFAFASAGEVDWTQLLHDLLAQLNATSQPDIPRIARHFHLTLVEMILRVAQSAGLEKVILSGGCFQNALLVEMAVEKLHNAGHEPLWHRRVPPNDGGIALGQAVIASRRLHGQND